MASRTPLATVAVLALLSVTSGESTSVRDFKGSLTGSFKDNSCALFSTLAASIGCSGVGEGPMTYIDGYTPHQSLPGKFIGVVSQAEMANVLYRAQRSDLQERLQGLIVMADNTTDYSLGPKSPLSEWYPDYANYEWNPTGLDLLSGEYLFPVSLAEPEYQEAIHQRVDRNLVSGFKSTVNVATLSAPSNATTVDSKGCLESSGTGKCIPLGGSTVWAAIPPFPVNEPPSMKIVLVVTHWDSRSFFPSATQGAESAFSGFMAMLAAADILHGEGGSESYTRHIVFMSLTGEAFSLMGTRRLLYEMHLGSKSTQGLDMNNVEMILEVGMVGLGQLVRPPNTDLFVHTVGSPVASGLAETLINVNTAPGTAQAKIADAGEPGLPPSSLLGLQYGAQSAELVYLADFAGTYLTKSFWGHHSSRTKIELGGIEDAAGTIAQALHRIVRGQSAPDIVINVVAVEKLMIELSDCLLKPGGLKCDLVQGMTSTSGDTAQHHIAGLVGLSDDEQDPYYRVKNDVERFTWEFLANRTFVGVPRTVSGDGDATTGCDPISLSCDDGEVCMHYHYKKRGSAAQGRCVKATVRYVPSYTTKAIWVSCTAIEDPQCKDGWLIDDTGGPETWEVGLGIPEDMMWTTPSEEDSNEPVTKWALHESDWTDGMVLGFGIVATLLTFAVTWQGQRSLMQHVKAQ